ncbi:MAG: 4Fe-4S dicluster domain-containing protein [Deltaproteobacteria bacterium]|nr:4Fe-4S dicluster domain-containing protein [Deltaproteobacteria bacterium]
MQKTYVVIPKNCTGCRTCELACSMVKGDNGTLGHSRISIFPTNESRSIQMTCLQCAEAACRTVCPTGALKRNEETGAIEVIDSLCVGCALCEAACPFGHIHFEREIGLPLKCDLCGGKPACVRFCPEKALEMR